MAQLKSSPARRSSQKANRSVSIGGDVVNSQVVVGDNNNIYVTQLNQRPNIMRLPAPILVGRPREAVDILDREVERNAVQTALDAKSPVEIYSPEGFGKTTLVSYLSSQMQLADGAVFLSLRAKSLDDIYFELFTAFYESDQVYKPSQVEYLRYFADLHALILLDDIGLRREEVQTLLSALPGCVFIFSSTERHLWDKGDVIHLGGLPLEIAVDLFKKRLGHVLSDAEESLAGKICAALQNNPLHIIQAAAAVRDDGESIAQLAQELQVPSAEKVLYDQILSALPDSKKQALALLTVMGGAPLPEEHMAKMLDSQNFSQLITGLLQQGLALAHSPRYSLADGLRNYLIATWDLSEWKNTTLQYFVNWTAGPVSQDQVLDASDALFAVLGNAAASGRWRELLQIGKAIESAFLFSGQWGAWTRLLNLLLQASRALGDRFNEAWVLHQLGSRALCMRDLTLAKDLLSQALNIRRAIGDRVGMSATQHNLGQLTTGGLPPNKPPSSTGGATSSGRWLFPFLGVIVLAGILFAGSVFLLFIVNLPASTSAPVSNAIDISTPTPTPAFPLNVLITPSGTETVTPTSTPLMPILDIQVRYPAPQSSETIMVYQDPQQDYFEIPVLITISDSSDAGIADGLDIAMQYETNDGTHPADFQPEGQGAYGYSVHEPSIYRGSDILLGAKVKIPKIYAGTFVKINVDVNRCQEKIECKIAGASVQLPKVMFDFVDNAPTAAWWGGVWFDSQKNELQQNQIIFNGNLYDNGGYVSLENAVALEDGSQPFYLFTHPKWQSYGTTTGYFDLSQVVLRPGDRFVARVGFRNGAQASDGVGFSVGCLMAGEHGLPHFLLQDAPKNYNKTLEEMLYSFSDKDVNSICSSTYYLQVNAGQASNTDWSVWVSAFIERP